MVLLRLIAALYKIGSESRLLMISRLANVNIVGEQIANHDIDGEQNKTRKCVCPNRHAERRQRAETGGSDSENSLTFISATESI